MSSDLFMLMNRPGTPFLYYSSIMRGMDIPNIFEGDIIEIKGEAYVVCYNSGFYAISLNTTQSIKSIKLRDCTGYKVVSNTYLKKDIKIEKVAKLGLKFRGITFSYNDIYGRYGDCLLINSNDGMLIPIREVQQEARVTYKGRKLYFGDFVDDGEVLLYKGQCCLKKGQRYYNIKNGGIIE